MHVSQLADRFVKDAHEVVKASDVVKVRVVDVDIPRKRIALSMRSDASADTAKPSRRDDNAGRQNSSRRDQGPAGEAGIAERLRCCLGGGDEEALGNHVKRQYSLSLSMACIVGETTTGQYPCRNIGLAGR